MVTIVLECECGETVRKSMDVDKAERWANMVLTACKNYTPVNIPVYGSDD